MQLTVLTRLIAIAFMSLTLAACESSEERAARFYESGKSLLEEGEVERAIIEFRNVLQADGSHLEARAAIAEAMLGLGDIGEGYRQYLRLVEQYPDHLMGRVTLAELSFQGNDFEEFDRHSQAAIELDPENTRVKIVDLAAKYRKATQDQDILTLNQIAREAEELVTGSPDSVILRRILVDSKLRDQDFEAAKEQLAAAIALEPFNRRLYGLQVGIATEEGDDTELERVLVQMNELFSDDQEIKEALVRFYVSRDRLPDAEAFIRADAEADPGNMDRYISLVRFIAQTRGLDESIAEIDARLSETPDNATLRSLRASLIFEKGEQDAAIQELQGVLANAEPSDETDRIKIALAQMLLVTENEVGARSLVEQVIERTPTNTSALKLLAGFQIEADDADAALRSLRTALDQNPQDSETMLMMSEAHVRAGNRDLARDFLSLAAESSSYAPQETLRYAMFLIEEERNLPAEDALIRGLRATPNNVDLLSELGGLYIVMKDMPRAEQVETTLRRMGTEDAVRIADELKLRILNQRNGSEDAIAFLEELAADDTDIAAQISLIRAKMASGDIQGALSSAREFTQRAPENATLKYALFAAEAANGNFDAAEAGYRSLIEEDPQRERVWLELIRIVARKGSLEETENTVDSALSAMPDSANLLWASASLMESQGDIDGAIDIYERIYAQNSDAIIVANNLASLLASYRDDAESLERAFSVARRLAGTNIPALQDTYGWILYKRGEHTEALEYLEPAAQGLPRDALVQVHLGMLYAALERRPDAIQQLRRAVEIAGPLDERPQILRAREELKKLEKAGTE